MTAGFTCSVVGPTTSVTGAATAGCAIVVSTRCTSSAVTLGCTDFTGNVTGPAVVKYAALIAATALSCTIAMPGTGGTAMGVTPLNLMAPS